MDKKLASAGPSETTFGWKSRGYLPHFEGGRLIQHITFRLADSLPQSVLRRIEEEVGNDKDTARQIELHERAEAWLDAGYGHCVLRRTEAATLVQDALFHFDGIRYRLIAWAIMPNHLHALIEPIDPWTIGRIVSTWKSYTGRRLSPMLRGVSRLNPHRVWNRDYWDRFIRDQGHFEDVVAYIHGNPVKAGLVSRPEDWQWSSAWIGRVGRR
jgi:type I restriction enzyme R subunit/putative DNA methylase